MNEFKILSVDGGGIRGVYPASVLDYIQQRMPGPLHQYFDMIVGTSTGAIIALGLALGKSTGEILDLYKTKSTKIFRKRIGWLNQGIIIPKYSNKHLINELKSFYGDALLGDCIVRACIPTIDIVNGKTVVRKTRHHEAWKNDFVRPVWEVAAESSSAPIYFPAYEDEKSCQFLDGGFWANNPTLIGIAEALKIGQSLNEIKVLSIGTGYKSFFKDGWTTKYFGLLGYRTSIIDITFQSQSQGVNNIASYLLEKENYIRVDKELPKAKKFFFFERFGLDKTGSIKRLITFAEDSAKENIHEIQRVFLKTKVSAFQPIPLTSEVTK